MLSLSPSWFHDLVSDQVYENTSQNVSQGKKDRLPSSLEVQLKTLCDVLPPLSVSGPVTPQDLFPFTAARAEVCSGTGERFRIFRAEKTYAVKAGRWYFEFEAVTAGDMRVGWSRPGCQPDQELGSDERAFAFDGFKVSRLC